jgi:hypothetical protein
MMTQLKATMLLSANLLAMSCGCGGYEVSMDYMPPSMEPISDPRLHAILSDFMDQCRIHDNRLCEKRLPRLMRMRFGEPEDIGQSPNQALERVGVCFEYVGLMGNKSYEVVLRNKEWSEVALRAIGFHELGHCLLNRQHSHGIMSPIQMDDENYIRDWDVMMEELFNTGNN